jgi:hypothetical protein
VGVIGNSRRQGAYAGWQRCRTLLVVLGVFAAGSLSLIVVGLLAILGGGLLQMAVARRT